MRVGLIADIHGNLAALDAVLAELETIRLDEIVCLGDVAVGPQPGATLDRIEALGLPVVCGNWDAWFVGAIPKLEGELGPRLAEIGAWGAAQLTDGHREYVRSFRPTYPLVLAGDSSLLCFHGSPRSNEDWMDAATPADELELMLAGSDEVVLAGGHTHAQLLRCHRDSLLVNPGSVGLPFRQQPGPIRIGRWAEYAVVAAVAGRLTVELRRVSYDVDSFLDEARVSGMPHADWWIGCWNGEDS